MALARDDIAAVANDSDHGLGAGIWTKGISKAHALAKKLRAGTAWINCCNVFDASLPFCWRSLSCPLAANMN